MRNILKSSFFFRYLQKSGCTGGLSISISPKTPGRWKWKWTASGTSRGLDTQYRSRDQNMLLPSFPFRLEFVTERDGRGKPVRDRHKNLFLSKKSERIRSLVPPPGSYTQGARMTSSTCMMDVIQVELYDRYHYPIAESRLRAATYDTASEDSSDTL